jgi:hypothetical protein
MATRKQQRDAALAEIKGAKTSGNQLKIITKANDLAWSTNGARVVLINRAYDLLPTDGAGAKLRRDIDQFRSQ